jgi:hypothetical protein
MSPELRSNNGQVDAFEISGDDISDFVLAKILALQIQTLLDGEFYKLAKMMLVNALHDSCAEKFVDASSEKKEALIRYKVHDDGKIQITGS